MTNEYPSSEVVANQVKEYFDRMSTTDKTRIMDAIRRVERKIVLAGLKPTVEKSDK